MANRRHLDPTDSAAALYGFKLRELRDAKGWGQARLAKAAFCSPELISKIETAAHPATLATSKLFDQIFGLCKPAMTFEELHHLVVRESTPEVVRSLADREASATVIRVFEPMVVTGLLQCDAYMRALMETGIERNTVDEAVATRMRRQSRVFGTVSPLLIVVFDEAEDSDTTHGGGHVPAVLVSPLAKAGYQSTTLYQHESTLRLMMEGLGVTDLPGAAASAPDMSEFFQ